MKATKKIVPPVPVEPEVEITITLTEKEAVRLRELLSGMHLGNFNDGSGQHFTTYNYIKTREEGVVTYHELIAPLYNELKEALR